MFSYNFSVEGHLSSQSNSVQDAWRFRATGAYRWYDEKNHWGFILNSSLKDESDRDLNFHRVSAELMLVPVWRQMAIGGYHPTYDSLNAAGNHLLFDGKRPIAGHPVQFRWQPYFGADLGGIVSGSESTLGMGVADESWLTQRTTVELKLNFLEEYSGIKDVLLYADNSLHYAIRSQETFNHFEAGLNFKLSENVGFGIVYKNGEEAPSFVKEETIQGAFTIIF